MTDKPIVVLRVAQILDRYNIVLTGDMVGELREHEELTVLSVSAPVAGTSTPLILRKATVVVTVVTDTYAVASTTSKVETVEVEVSDRATLAEQALLGLYSQPKTRKEMRQVETRNKLNVSDEEMTGNPSHTPVRIGDYVIRWSDLKRFAAKLASDGRL